MKDRIKELVQEMWDLVYNEEGNWREKSLILADWKQALQTLEAEVREEIAKEIEAAPSTLHDFDKFKFGLVEKLRGSERKSCKKVGLENATMGEPIMIGSRMMETKTKKRGYVRRSKYGNLFCFETDDGECWEPHQLINLVPISREDK